MCIKTLNVDNKKYTPYRIGGETSTVYLGKLI